MASTSPSRPTDVQVKRPATEDDLPDLRFMALDFSMEEFVYRLGSFCSPLGTVILPLLRLDMRAWMLMRISARSGCFLTELK